MTGLVEEPAQNSAAIACAMSEAATFRFGEQNPFRRLVATAAVVTAPAIVETGAMVGTGTDGEIGWLTARPPSVLTVGEMLGTEIGIVGGSTISPREKKCSKFRQSGV